MNTDTGIVMPRFNIEAEQAVLGGVLLCNEMMDDVSQVLREDNFFRNEHRIIYRAMCELSKASLPIDIVTLSERLERDGTLDLAGGIQYMASVARDTPSVANILTYANIVKEDSVRRMAQAAVMDAVGGIQHDDNAVETLISKLLALSEDRQVTDHGMDAAVDEAIERIDDAMNRGEFHGLKTGVKSLDKALGGGYYAGDLIVIGARPRLGKTSLLLDGILASAKNGIKVGVISTEQPKHQLAERLISKKTGVPVSKMRSGELTQEEFKQVFEASKVMRLLPIRSSDVPKPTITNVARIARQWKKKHGIKGLFVDYIQRLRGDDPRADRATQTAEVVAGLKTIARELDIPVVALSQVNRDVDKRTNKRPFLADFAWSSDIEAEADFAITIYREAVYNENTHKKHEAELGIVKARHGEAGVAYATFRGEYMSFADVTEEREAPPARSWAD